MDREVFPKWVAPTLAGVFITFVGSAFITAFYSGGSYYQLKEMALQQEKANEKIEVMSTNQTTLLEKVSNLEKSDEKQDKDIANMKGDVLTIKAILKP